MKKILLISAIILLLAAVLGAGYIALRHVPADTYTVEEIDTDAHWGSITGSLSYPGEAIPPLGVCAVVTKGTDMYCTYKMLESDDYQYGYGYELSVPPDTYYVFAHTITEGNEKIGYTDEYKAYYSQFVTCGLEYDCPSHKPIPIKIEPYQNVQGIDPADWYNQ
jgi:hypothetical protein